MNISYNWLKRYIDFSLSPRELAAALTSVGLECDHIEEVESIKGSLKGIVIGKVLTCEEHPNSDHLHITTVDLGNGEPTQIVCGAPNVAAGQTVVVATVGTTLYDGDKEFQIKKSKIRGTESFGMICAEDEIGVGSSHDGIIVLDEEIAPGTPAAQYYKVETDYMLEVELTPNRVDAASHYGVARDLRAYLARNNEQGEIPQIFTPSVADFRIDKATGGATVEVDDEKGCPRYSGISVRGVKVQESPEWLKRLLTAAGQRPINNIVDITNFILLGLGQPLHCFDLDKVAGEKIVVRTCPKGTKFTTLDGVEHELDESDLMICDAEKPMCIAGVFGGLDSGVTENTANVFIESAWFSSTRVRRTARRHGLSTDASFRYERGTDPLITVYAAKVAALMVKELAGGEICGPLEDVCAKNPEPFKVDLSLDYADKLIGKHIPEELVKRILKALEINIEPESTDRDLKLEVPPYRVDVTRPCDVVEEILRIYGYNNVEEPQVARSRQSQLSASDYSYRLKELISDRLTARGFNEILNNSLTAEGYYAENEVYPIAESVRIINPLSGDLALMRQTLLYGGLESIEHNINRKAHDLNFYEFGNVYHKDPSKESTLQEPLAPYDEQEMLALWVTGSDRPSAWNAKPEQSDFYRLSGEVQALLARIGIDTEALTLTPSSDAIFSAALEIVNAGGKRVGRMGVLRHAVLKPFDISQEVYYAELVWPMVCKLAKRNEVVFKPLAKTMPVKRDLALLLDSGITFQQVKQVVKRTEKKLLKDVVLFDVYEGDKLPEGKKSYAISITLQDDEKTLVDKQIDNTMNKIIASLKRDLNAELR